MRSGSASGSEGAAGNSGTPQQPSATPGSPVGETELFLGEF